MPCATAQTARTYRIRRDRWLEGLGVEEMDLPADRLSDDELTGKTGGLSAESRAEALREIGCIVEEGPRGPEVVTDPALDGDDAAQVAA